MLVSLHQEQLHVHASLQLRYMMNAMCLPSSEIQGSPGKPAPCLQRDQSKGGQHPDRSPL